MTNPQQIEAMESDKTDLLRRVLSIADASANDAWALAAQLRHGALRITSLTNQSQHLARLYYSVTCIFRQTQDHSAR